MAYRHCAGPLDVVIELDNSFISEQTVLRRVLGGRWNAGHFDERAK